MKTIFEIFKKSIYNPAFYQKTEDMSFTNAVGYYAKATALLAILLVVAVSAFLIPRGVVFVKERAPYLVNSYYPEELTVTIEKGIASANVPMPYFVPLKLLSKATTTDAIQNMLVIDTTQGFDKETFEKYSTYALLTRTDIVTRDSEGAITIQPLHGITTTISREVLLSWVETIRNSLWWVSVLGIVFAFMLVFSGYVMYLIPLLLFALVPKLVAYLKGIPLPYSLAYTMSLYAIIPALALKTILNAMGVFFLPPYFTLLVFILIIVTNMRAPQQPTLFENK